VASKDKAWQLMEILGIAESCDRISAQRMRAQERIRVGSSSGIRARMQVEINRRFNKAIRGMASSLIRRMLEEKLSDREIEELIRNNYRPDFECCRYLVFITEMHQEAMSLVAKNHARLTEELERIKSEVAQEFGFIDPG